MDKDNEKKFRKLNNLTRHIDNTLSYELVRMNFYPIPFNSNPEINSVSFHPIPTPDNSLSGSLLFENLQASNDNTNHLGPIISRLIHMNTLLEKISRHMDNTPPCKLNSQIKNILTVRFTAFWKYVIDTYHNNLIDLRLVQINPSMEEIW